MIIDKLFIIQTLTNEVISHGLRSGEIIILLDQIKKPSTNSKDIVDTFFECHSIKTDSKQFEILEISEKDAIASIIYGLSTKPNYTKINKPFTKSDQNMLAYNFIQLFNNPTYYTVDTRLYKTDLDLQDFWESGGTIAIDKNVVGLFWTNDLYDKF